MSQKILERARELEPWIIENRRHFHKHPEASMEEYWTTDEICKILDEWDIPYQRFENLTGCLARIDGRYPGKTVALRSDIDALTVLEKNDIPYKSEREGFMHACGHDAHLTMNLAAAKILSEMKDELHGTVLHIFQPGEEIAMGAKSIIEAGDWFDEVDNVFGTHIWNDLDAGLISVEAGPRMAAADHFTIDIEGRSGHAAQPEQTIDATIVACAMVNNFQTLVSREVSPIESLVITVGKLTSGTRFNIISGSARLEGTVRYFSRDLSANIDAMMERVVNNTAALYRAKATLNYQHLTHPVINEETSSQRALNAINTLFGEGVAVNFEKIAGAEDFSEYMLNKPGVFAFLGSRNPEIGADAPHHSDYFNVDESVMKNGAALYAQYAYDFLTEDA